MLEIVIKFIAALIALVGVILVYDARIITKKIFVDYFYYFKITVNCYLLKSTYL